MCGNNMSLPLLKEAATVSGSEKETAAVSENISLSSVIFPSVCGNLVDDLAERSLKAMNNSLFLLKTHCVCNKKPHLLLHL